MNRMNVRLSLVWDGWELRMEKRPCRGLRSFQAEACCRMGFVSKDAFETTAPVTGADTNVHLIERTRNGRSVRAGAHSCKVFFPDRHTNSQISE